MNNIKNRLLIQILGNQLIILNQLKMGKHERAFYSDKDIEDRRRKSLDLLKEALK